MKMEIKWTLSFLEHFLHHSHKQTFINFKVSWEKVNIFYDISETMLSLFNEKMLLILFGKEY